MAGEGIRFKEAGIKIPKYMIEVEGKKLFTWSMMSLNKFIEIDNKFIFITRKSHNSISFIKNETKKLNIKNFEILELNHLTDGQATTCLQVKDIINKEKPIAIYNIDTFVEKNVINPTDISGDGWVPVFNVEGIHWSFILPKTDYVVKTIKEKERISELGSIGFYYFKSYNLFERAYINTYEKGNNRDIIERYVAPIYNAIIKEGGDVCYKILPASKIHVLGTPDELKHFKNPYKNNS
jgi:choline kinase